MDATTMIANINWLSVFLAALSAFVIGGLWYGPLFGKVWMQEWGYTTEDIKKGNPAKTFGVSFLLMLVSAVNLDMFLGADSDLAMGIFAGFLAGLGWVAMFLGVLYLFEMRSLKIWLINAGYCTISLTVMGAILGAL